MEGVILPMVVLLIDPPVMATLFAFCAAMVPRPETELLVMAIGVEVAAVRRP